MPKNDSTLPEDWFYQAELDLQSVKILLHEDGPTSIIAFHLHQTTEKYLKGYLLSKGWTLRRIHDLEVLLQEAIARDGDFIPFQESCQRITEYYIETRYPLGIFSDIQKETLEADLEVVKNLVELIRQKIIG